jgi:hypothetical protein
VCLGGLEDGDAAALGSQWSDKPVPELSVDYEPLDDKHTSEIL